MLKNLLVLLICLLVTQFCHAQIIDGLPGDSTLVRFNGSMAPAIINDTTSVHLWQTGHTHKSFFATDSTGTSGIMTDTTNFYPPLANTYFAVKISGWDGITVDFWHKYQTNTAHGGGIVEFSMDSLIWQNIKGPCNVDSFFGDGAGIRTAGFYTFADTLFDGEPAFTGTSVGEQYSRLEFWPGPPAKTTGTTSVPCSFGSTNRYIRFRFVSDSTVDSLAGWMIDSIKIERDVYGGGGVSSVNKQGQLHVFPNPSYNGSFNFPAITNEAEFTTEIYNAIGQRVLVSPYHEQLALTGEPKGMYFYKVGNGVLYYSGQLRLE